MGKVRPLGVLLGLAGCGVFGWGLYNLLGIGSCGGEYPPCPDEAIPWIIALPVGLIVSIISIFLGGSGAIFLLIFATVGASSLLRAANGGVDGDTTFPLIFGLGFLVVPLLPLAFAVVALRRSRRAAQLIQEGKTGTATVLSVHDTGVTINDNPRVRLRVRIEPQDGTAAFEGEKAVTVSRLKIPRAGDRHRAWYDPQDRNTFGLDGDAEPSAPPPSAPEPARQDDWVTELGRLNDLRLKGALTDEEFAAAKAKLLK